MEAAAVADPALVDLVVLVRGDAHELATALPLRDAAADRALRADRFSVGHVPRPGLETPDPRREGADWTEVDDVAAEDRLQRLAALARDERLDASLVGGQRPLPGNLVVVAGGAGGRRAGLGGRG